LIGQDFLSPHLIDLVIRIFRHPGHGNHQRVRESLLLGRHLHDTPHEMGHHQLEFHFRSLRTLAEAHGHPDRMDVKREGFQGLKAGVSLRYALEDASQDVP
jgi:hypothetical protein